MWNSTAGEYSPGGLYYPEYNTTDECLYACEMASACVAVDVILENVTTYSIVHCIIHTYADDITVRYSALSATQYTINERCQPTSMTSLLIYHKCL